MNFKKYCVPMLLLCVLLVNEIKQTNSREVDEVVKDTYLESLPLMAGIASLALTGPVGIAIVSALAFLQLVSKILISDEKDDETKTDFLESQSKIVDAVTKVDSHLSEVYEKLNLAIESSEIMNDMRNDLDYFHNAYDYSMKIILDPKVTWRIREKLIEEMVYFFRAFRQKLSSFVSMYITPDGHVSAAGQVKLFFDFVLSKQNIEIDSGEDCHSESTHTKIFKSYIYIFKTLTEAYVMVVAAHSVLYQIELKKPDPQSAIDTQEDGLKVLNEYKTDMKALMEKAKWAMDKASREIRNCGTFELKRGETFESIPFAHILPIFKGVTSRGCETFNRFESINIEEYDIDYTKCIDIGSDRFTVTPFINSNYKYWPYLYMKQSHSTDKFFGHVKTGPGVRSSKTFFGTQNCKSKFCPAFKRAAILFYSQIVRAKPGNVITGLRFRKETNGPRHLIYIDIQEGKFLDDLSVDPETVIWTKTPAGSIKHYIFLTPKIRKIELDVAELNPNEYLTAIQLKQKDGTIGLYVGGGNRASNWTTSEFLTGSLYRRKSNELVLSGCDNPEQFGAGVKNMISKVPVPFRSFYVSFQATDFEKDFGSNTIPYIDMRAVISNPPAPLAGFGIDHQAVNGSGGFISLKLLALNLNRFIDYKLIEAINITNIKV